MAIFVVLPISFLKYRPNPGTMCWIMHDIRLPPGNMYGLNRTYQEPIIIPKNSTRYR